MTPVFGHGHLRLYLLSLLDESPKHGYELIQALEDRFGGTYVPSAGTIYPRLPDAPNCTPAPASLAGLRTRSRIRSVAWPMRFAPRSTPR
jgi:hypothetical protein